MLYTYAYPGYDLESSIFMIGEFTKNLHNSPFNTATYKNGEILKTLNYKLPNSLQNLIK